MAARPTAMESMTSRKKLILPGRYSGPAAAIAITQMIGSQISQAAPHRFGFRKSIPRTISQGRSDGATLGNAQS